MQKKRYRLLVDITPKQHMFLNNLPYGWKKQIFGALIDMIIEMTRQEGIKSLSSIISHNINLNNFFQKS